MADNQDNHGYNEYDNFAFHPYNVMLFLSMFGISALFLAFSGAFIYTRVQNDLPPIKLPWIFLLNTVILLLSSYTMHLSQKAYKSDDTNGYKKTLLWTIIISFIFMLMQIFGWVQMTTSGILVTKDVSTSYLYLISFVHFLHLLFGIPFLAWFYWMAKKKMVEPVSVLVYFSDPEKKLRLRLLTIYWHFLDGLWIYLVLFFWINYLIKDML